MSVPSLVISLIVIVLRFFLALVVYFCARFCLARANSWHLKQGGFKVSDEGERIYKFRPIPSGVQTALCVLAGCGVFLA